MNAFSPREEELLARLKWFVSLRWLFLIGLAALLAAGKILFHLHIEYGPILLVALLVSVYNFGLYHLHRSLRPGWKPVATPRGLRIEANLQIGLDLLALVALIHFSGGIENPFIFFFVFHMIMGSILLTGKDIWFHAAAALLLLFLLLVLTYFQVVERHHIGGFGSPELWQNAPYLWAGAVSFGATLLMTVYLTSSIARSVQGREQELYVAKVQLEKKSSELEHVNRELIRQQSLLIQSEKLASLGKLSAGIAHELNSPLTGVLSFSHFIKDACVDNPQAQHDIAVVIRETERCKKIIKGLLDFARQSEPEKKMADVVQILLKTISLVEHHKDFKNIEIVKDLDPGLPPIMLDQDQIQQVFMNLTVNAQEAMEGGGTLHVRARLDSSGKWIWIMFRDSGTGIGEEVMTKIFDPFFTTKEMGTGLGLSISMGLIEKHGGTLEVQSSPGKGSTFIVKLPVHPETEEV